jgi:PAS domain S-box-containing protein
VDDSSEDRELYRRYLQRDSNYSYTFLEASLGRQGLELWQQQRPDLVLLDYRLPDLDGLEFLAQLPSLTPQPCLPVIVMTGQGNETIAVQSMKAGAQDYLIKEQITPEVVYLAVSGAIETVRLRTELQQRIERERLVGQITWQIHQSLDLDYILQTTVTEVRQFLNTDRVLVFQLHPDGHGTVVAESVGDGWQSLLSSTIYDPCLAENYLRFSRPDSLNLDPGFAEDYVKRYRQGQVTAIPDIYASAIDPCHIELLAQFQVRANLVVPILHDDRLWGLLIAHDCTAPNQWQSLEIDLLKELATQMGIALRQAELYQQAQTELAERKRVETELRDSEERLRSALEASRMGTWDWNIATGQIQWSDNLEAMFGLEAGAFDGSFQMFSERLHPDDRDRVLAAVEQAVSTGEDYKIEFRVVYPNGTVRWALSQGKAFYDQNGLPVRMAGNDIDITDRKLVEIALQESESRFRQLAENIDVVFWTKEATEDQVSYVSPAYGRLWGLNPEELYESQRAWVKYIHPDDRAAVDEAFQTKATAGLFDEEYRIILPNGQVRWVHDRCFPLRDQAGTLYRFTGIAEDITDHKQIEEMVRLQAQVLDQTHDSVITTDLDGNIISWNKGAERVFGYTPEEVLGQPVAMLYPPDQQETLWNQVIAPLKANGEHEVEVVNQRKSGEQFDLLLSLSLLRNEHQNPIGMIGFSIDITDRKRSEQALRKSEERFRTSVENMLDCFGIYEAIRNQQGDIVDFRTEYVNDAACLNNQLTWEQQIGRGLCELLPGHRDSGLFDEYCQVVETGQSLVKESLVYEDDYGEQRLTRAFDIRIAKLGDGFVATWRDITDRKQTEEALRQNEELLRLALAGAQAGSWDWEIPTGKVTWSPENYALYGVDPATTAACYETWYDALHPDDRESMNAEVMRVVEQRLSELRIEFRIIHPQQGLRWLLALGQLILDEQGNPLRLSGINLDITERKQTEEMLRRTAERDAFRVLLADALRSLSDPVEVEATASRILGEYLGANRVAYFQVHGTNYYVERDYINGAEPLRGEFPIELFGSKLIATYRAGQVVSAVDVAADPDLSLEQRSAYAAIQIAAHIGIPLIKNGALVAGLAIHSATPRVWTPEEISLVAEVAERTWADVERARTETALRASHKTFRHLVEHSPFGVYVVDADFCLSQVSAGAQKVFENVRPLLGRDFAEVLRILWPEPFASEAIARFRHTLETGEPYHAPSTIERRQDIDDVESYDWKIERITLPDERLGVVCHFYDLSERQQLLQREQASRAEAERANRIKDEFLAVLSHELRSPLNPILGWAKLLQTRTFDTARTADALATIERNAKLQTQLIDDLLDVAKILRGKLSLEMATVDLVFVIEAAIDVVRTAAVAKNIHLHPVLPQIGRVSGDPTRLQQVVWNLLSNAIKFTPNNGRVEIRLECVENQAQITVSDTGKGIKPDFLPYIFESFCQEDTTTTRQYGGLGLGLAIVRHLVEAHGGTIGADSAGEGQGTTFTVRFPLLESELAGYQSEALLEQELNLTGIRVLAVDDEPDARELLSVLLSQYGAEVLTVNSATEVLERLESFQPNVLVSDIGMPQMDGFALIQQIRALPSEKGGQIPAIALTAYARQEDYQQIIANGYQRHVTKPLDPEQLVQAIMTVSTVGARS